MDQLGATLMEIRLYVEDLILDKENILEGRVRMLYTAIHVTEYVVH